jgi:glutamate racemase
VKCAVIACNTASVVALSDLRKKYAIPFVGVVPAVKPAAEASSKKRFAVIATERTVNDAYLKNLIDSFAHNCEVIAIPAPGLVDFVEKRFFSSTEKEKIDAVGCVLKQLEGHEVDSVVLGCTHYIHLKEEFERVLGKGVSVIDSRDGVVSQLVRVLESNGLQADHKSGESEFYLTGIPPAEPSYLKFAEQYGLRFCGFLEE